MNEPTAMELSSEAQPTPAANIANPTDQQAPTPPPAPAPAVPVAPSGARRRTKPPRAPKNAPTPTSDDAASEQDMTPTRKRRRIARMADSGLLPALRLNGYVGRQRSEPKLKPNVVYDTGQTPKHLRLTRLAVGLALLALAWCASLLVAALSESLWNVFPDQPSLTVRFGLYVLGAIGIIWLAVVGLALILVGALSLSLALTRRGW